MSLYGDSHRALHEQFDSQRMAALLETMDTDEVQPQHKAFIESRDMFWLATVDSEGRPQCQYKGGAPGFIRVIDPKTVVFPSYDGNGRYHSMGNIGATGQVGLLFLDFESPNRLRLQGEATVSADDPLLAEYKDAELIVRIKVSHVIINCPRYIHRMKRVERAVEADRRGAGGPVGEGPGTRRAVRRPHHDGAVGGQPDEGRRRLDAATPCDPMEARSFRGSAGSATAGPAAPGAAYGFPRRAQMQTMPVQWCSALTSRGREPVTVTERSQEDRLDRRAP
jgi:predicted pyridoxine 5'-phosphate oxidase superfamily flavin-nucleotide-binding protein